MKLKSIWLTCIALILVVGLPLGIAGRSAFAAGDDQSLDAPVSSNPDGPAPVLNLHFLPAGERNAQSDARVNILVQLKGDALYKAYLAAGGGRHANTDTQRRTAAAIHTEQAPVVSAVSQYGTVVGHVQNVINGIVVTGVKVSDLAAISQLPDVKAIDVDHQVKLELSTSVPFSGGQALLNANTPVSGRGMRIAMLDTGIDYTHADFGGPATQEAVTYAVSQRSSQSLPIVDPQTHVNLFPNDKVIGGYDFTGDTWDGTGNTPYTPDANPIDVIPPTGSGDHGTHTSGITSGFGVPANYDASQFIDEATNSYGKIPADSYFKSEDPSNPATFSVFHGMAPADQLYMYKVCSSQPNVNSCGTVPMLEAVDRALDPNQEGDLNDHVDAISMSIGGGFGTDELLAQGFHNAVLAGVPTAISAGNSSDVPFIVGHPSTADNVLSVASLTASINNSRPLYGLGTSPSVGVIPFIWQPWSGALTQAGVTAPGALAPPLQANGQPSLGCPDPNTGKAYPDGSLTGKVAIISRGTCAISDKGYAAQQAGAVAAVVISQSGNAPAAASLGTFQPTIPVVMIANAPGLNLVAAVKAQTENVTVASTSIGDLADVMSGFSSRGPYRGGTLKPDISAPGDGVVSAGAGTGIGGFNFSGTSMAAPHVGGSLILLRELHPDWTAQELEAELMNTAYPNAKVTDFSTNNFGLAPISRQGAGRLAVDQAAASDTVILAGPIASLSYGEPAPSTTTTYSQTMTIENKGATMRTYSLSSEVRPDLTAGGGSNVLSDVASIPGVTLSFSKGGLPVNSVNVNPGQSVSVSVNMQINPTALLTYFGNPTPARWMKSFIDVSRINSLLRLDQNEIAGLVDVTESGTGTIFHVPFHALPRAASSISTGATVNQTTSTISNLSLVNSGTSKGTTELFNLGSIDPQDAPVLTGLNGVPTQSSAEFDIKYVAARYTPNVAGAFGAYGPAYQFAITTFGARPNPIDAEFDTYVDVNNDGKPDFVVFNTDPGNITGAGATGGNCVFVYSLSAKSIVPVGPLQGDACVAGTDSNNNLVSYGVFADTQINSANLIETVPLTAFGLDGPAKIQYYTFSFSNLGVDESGVFSYGNAPVDVAPDKYATAFDPNKQLYTPAFQTVTTAASSASNDSVTTNTGATDLEVGTLSYYQNNNPANTEAQYVITRRGFQNLLFTYMRGVQAIPLVQELNHANLTAFRVGLLNYERSGVLTSGEYNLLQSLFQQTYANP